MNTSQHNNDKDRARVWTGSEFTQLMVEWHAAAANPAENSQTSGLHASRREINGRHVWVLLDRHDDVIEVAESRETLTADHPRAHIAVPD